MIDYKIKTFLTVCDTMNYRIAAERLNLTQPAITQHIQTLEREYNCRLFEYSGRKLHKTKYAELLEGYARSAAYTEAEFRTALSSEAVTPLKIGATKTIGEYVLPPKISELAMRDDICLSLIVENTDILLKMLDHSKINIALIEGYFDKKMYGYDLFRKENFIGICSPTHPFAGREITATELQGETIIYREHGSGTRAILEQILYDLNLSLGSFKKGICISSFEIIKLLVKQNSGISFVYKSVAESDNSISTFNIKDKNIEREFNFVYLKNTDAEKWEKYFI